MLNYGDNLFVFPHKGKYIVYNNIDRSIVVINNDALNALKYAAISGSDNELFPELFTTLREFGIKLSDTRSSADLIGLSDEDIIGNFKPTAVALFPSNNCNLRCIYCYSAASCGSTVMAKDVAEAAISYAHSNAVQLGAGRTDLVFHGGGEPFFVEAWKLTKHAFDFATDSAKRRSLKLETFASTNGVLSKAQLEWIVKNKIRIQFSFDGPESIQNANRPLANGGASYPYILRSIKFLEEAGQSYAIRATITNDSVLRLPELVDFFSSISSSKRYHFEPLFECGRCATSGAEAPEPGLFVEKIWGARTYAARHGKEIFFSLGDIDHRPRFCGALSPGFAVTPDGFVTSCYEVTRQDDPRAAVFFYGQHDLSADCQFSFDAARMRRLQARTVDNLTGCRLCVARYTCAGDCPAKFKGDIYDTMSNRDRCVIAQGHLLQHLRRAADELIEGEKNAAS